MKDTYNYRALYRHSYTIRGAMLKGLLGGGGIAYSFSFETFIVVLLAFIFDIPLIYLAIRYVPQYSLAVILGIPWLVYKLYDTVIPDGLKVHQWAWQYLKYLWIYRVKNRHLNNDEEVYFTDIGSEIQIY
ncbi:hypothetical protein WOSG25_050270 [Weissella oryzae SG25]|uniref:TcpE family protein n=1 Tax=Weissella oryzae (strain DSM 25784 / JCM 18191 / LMG 30913 / SG25) TaxID=1329250 RepID=A0A069CSG5_WEIOS|nr:hypothetical protein [Weissella oryzae]GAK30755.1 hypothetical protein WOSG25_050270 [Weissella oryzae SG25]